ncbi:MAG: terminase family protein [Sphingomonadales bacterium]|jgi:phage terminase large subunit-like protein
MADVPQSDMPLIDVYRLLPGWLRRQLLRRHGEEIMVAGLSGDASLRPAQRPPPGDWGIWVILAGRGFGKTHAGAEWVHAQAAGSRPRRIALVAPTLDVARAVMVEGQSGLLARRPPGVQLTWQPSTKRLVWDNGSEARLYSGAEPDALRGSQFDCAWGDEFAHWPGGEVSLMNLRMATRLGPCPQILLTTTPLPLDWLKTLITEPDVVVTRGASADNQANLSETYLVRLQHKFGGTRTGRQELAGEIVEDHDGALWTRELIECQRIAVAPPLVRVVIGVDPPSGSGTCGILVAGFAQDGRAIVIDDASVTGQRPEQWARAVVNAADRWQADRVIAEVNQGGAMVTALLKSVDAALPVQAVHAARGKVARAEPVAALYAEGRVAHAGAFPALVMDEANMIVFRGGWQAHWPVAGLRIGGRTLLAAAPATIGPPTGGVNVDSEARSSLTALILALRDLGLLAP